MNLKTIAAAIRNALGLNPSVDSIVSSMDKKVAALNEAAVRHRIEAQRLYDVANAIEDSADDHVDEAVRASRIAARFAQLVN